MVMSIIAANKIKEIMIFNEDHVLGETSHIIQLTSPRRTAPISKPIPATARPDRFPFERKAIKAIKPNVPAVIPKASPKTLQSIKIVNDERRTPMNIVNNIDGTIRE